MRHIPPVVAPSSVPVSSTGACIGYGTAHAGFRDVHGKKFSLQFEIVDNRKVEEHNRPNGGGDCVCARVCAWVRVRARVNARSPGVRVTVSLCPCACASVGVRAIVRIRGFVPCLCVCASVPVHAYAHLLAGMHACTRACVRASVRICMLSMLIFVHTVAYHVMVVSDSACCTLDCLPHRSVHCRRTRACTTSL